MTSIEWTDKSINPIRARLNGYDGHHCQKISDGCKHCYASNFQPRFGMPTFDKAVGRKMVEHYLDVSKFEQVLRRREPTKWFWSDMTDLFGEWVSFEWIAACVGVMLATPWHTHQILTKRSKRLLAFHRWVNQNGDADRVVACQAARVLYPSENDRGAHLMFEHHAAGEWPPPNVWWGVSAEDQNHANERVSRLLRCPAAVRFVSAEPLLGPIRFGDVPGLNLVGQAGLDLLRNFWVIVGGESGHGARPMAERWALSIRDQCERANVPFFFKQWGAWEPAGQVVEFEHGPIDAAGAEEGFSLRKKDAGHRILYRVVDGKWMRRVGKKKAGRLLDGRLYDGYPRGAAA